MDCPNDVRLKGPQAGLGTTDQSPSEGRLCCWQWSADATNGSGGRVEREAEEGCEQQLKLCQMLGLPATNGKLAR